MGWIWVIRTVAVGIGLVLAMVLLLVRELVLLPVRVLRGLGDISRYGWRALWRVTL